MKNLQTIIQEKLRIGKSIKINEYIDSVQEFCKTYNLKLYTSSDYMLLCEIQCSDDFMQSFIQQTNKYNLQNESIFNKVIIDNNLYPNNSEETTYRISTLPGSKLVRNITVWEKDETTYQARLFIHELNHSFQIYSQSEIEDQYVKSLIKIMDFIIKHK